MDSRYLIENDIRLKESINYLSYSRLYFWWKKSKIIYNLVEKELRKRKINKILDLGCGQGDDLFYLSNLYGKKYKLFFAGIDINLKDIEFAKVRKKISQNKNISFIVGDATDLEIDDETFDLVICSEVVEHLKFPEKALCEMKRVLKQGGLAIITTPNKTNPIIRLRKLFAASKQFQIDKDKTQQKLFRHLSVKGVNEWIDLFKKTGFKIEKIRRGSLIFGGAQIDSYRFGFILILLFDVVLDFLPFSQNWAEQNIFCLRK